MKLIYALFALDMLSLALNIPVFGPFIRHLGGSHFFIGVMNSSQALISLLWNPVIGSLGDATGRKHLLIKCMMVSLVGNLLMSMTTSLTLIFIARLICGFASPVGILLRTIVTDIAKSQEEKNSIFGKVGLMHGLAFIVGAVLSGFISETKNGVSTVYLLVFINSLINIALATQLPDDRKLKEPASVETSLINSFTTEIKSAANNFINLDWKIYWDIFSIKVLTEFSFGLFVSNIGLLLAEEYNIVGRKLGFLFLLLSLSSMAANILKMRLKNLLPSSDYTKLAFGASIMTVSFLGLGLLTPLVLFMVATAVNSAGRALMDTLLTEVVTSRATGQDKGKVISAFDNLMPLAQFVAPITSGVIADRLGERYTILFAIIPMSISLAVIFNRKRKQDLKTE